MGTFIADCMRMAAKTEIAMISTGYTSHALRYEKDKILTHYNLERAFSADEPLQTVVLTPQELKEVFDNAVKYRYLIPTGNVRFCNVHKMWKFAAAAEKIMRAKSHRFILAVSRC